MTRIFPYHGTLTNFTRRVFFSGTFLLLEGWPVTSDGIRALPLLLIVDVLWWRRARVGRGPQYVPGIARVPIFPAREQLLEGVHLTLRKNVRSPLHLAGERISGKKSPPLPTPLHQIYHRCLWRYRYSKPSLSQPSKLSVFLLWRFFTCHVWVTSNSMATWDRGENGDQKRTVAVGELGKRNKRMSNDNSQVRGAAISLGWAQRALDKRSLVRCGVARRTEMGRTWNEKFCVWRFEKLRWRSLGYILVGFCWNLDNLEPIVNYKYL